MLCPGFCDASPGPPSKGSSSPPRPSATVFSDGDIFFKSSLPFNQKKIWNMLNGSSKICMCACRG